MLATEDVPMVAEYADVLQIGARNMQNYRLLEAVGKTNRPVLLKRGPARRWKNCCWPPNTSSTPAIRTSCSASAASARSRAHTRFTLPLATVPYLHAKTHLPVVVDPSHGTGHATWCRHMAAASVAAGADGLIIEVHPDPENAMSDGYQSLDSEPNSARRWRCAAKWPRRLGGRCRDASILPRAG